MADLRHRSSFERHLPRIPQQQKPAPNLPVVAGASRPIRHGVTPRRLHTQSKKNKAIDFGFYLVCLLFPFGEQSSSPPDSQPPTLHARCTFALEARSFFFYTHKPCRRIPMTDPGPRSPRLTPPLSFPASRVPYVLAPSSGLRANARCLVDFCGVCRQMPWHFRIGFLALHEPIKERSMGNDCQTLWHDSWAWLCVE